MLAKSLNTEKNSPIHAATTKKIEVVEDSARMRASDTPVVMGDASLARRLLEWTPKRDFSHTLRSILDYFRSSSELL